MIRRLLALKLPLSWRQWCKQMIYIKKRTEPSSLKEYRSQPNATYEGFRDKDDIRKALLKEQGCLCAYCMSRRTKENMKIEYWSPQNPEDGDGEAKALDYSTDVEVKEDDHILTLITCDRSYGGASGRLIVMAVQE